MCFTLWFSCRQHSANECKHSEVRNSTTPNERERPSNTLCSFVQLLLPSYFGCHVHLVLCCFWIHYVYIHWWSVDGINDLPILCAHWFNCYCHLCTSERFAWMVWPHLGRDHQHSESLQVTFIQEVVIQSSLKSNLPRRSQLESLDSLYLTVYFSPMMASLPTVTSISTMTLLSGADHWEDRFYSSIWNNYFLLFCCFVGEKCLPHGVKSIFQVVQTVAVFFWVHYSSSATRTTLERERHFKRRDLWFICKVSFIDWW